MTTSFTALGFGVNATPISSTNGGTGNAFTKFTGPASSEKTFTLPNVSATLVYDGKPAVEVICASSGALSAAQVSGTILNNYGQGAADVAMTLPTAAAGMSFVAVMGTTQAGNYWKVTADTDDKIYLDGTGGTDNQSAIFATPTVGNYMSGFTFKTGAATWDWIVKTGNGTVTAGV